MNKCDKSEYQLFDSMIRFIKNGVLLLREPQVLLNSKNENLLIVSLLYHRLVIATNFPYLDFHDAI